MKFGVIRFPGSCDEVDAADATAARVQVEQMCERLLANPLIESYEIEVG